MVPELGPKPKCAVNSFWLRKLLPALISRTISSPATLASGSTVMNAPMPSRLEVGSLDLDLQPVVVVAAVVAVEDRLGAVVDDEDVQVAVVIVVKTEQASSHASIGNARGIGDVGKHAVIVLVEVRLVGWIAVSQPLVTNRSRSRSLSWSRKVVPHDHPESRTPAEVGLVGEGAVAVVPEEAVAAVVCKPAGYIDQGRNEPIQPPVAVEVADGASHAVLVRAHAGGGGAVGERAVAIVPEISGWS